MASSRCFAFHVLFSLVCLGHVAALSKTGKGKGDSLGSAEKSCTPQNVAASSEPEDKFLLYATQRCDLVKTLAKWNGPSGSNVTVYMYGDSLMRMQFNALCYTTGEVLSPQLHKSTFVEGQELGVPGNYCTEIQTCEIPLPKGGKLTAAYIGVHEAAIHRFDLLEHMRANTNAPDILYFNSAFHYLHMSPPTEFDRYQLWLNYEEKFTSFLNHPIVQEVPKVTFMYSHAICESQYTGEYTDVLNTLHSDAAQAAKPCVEYVEEHFIDMKREKSDPFYVDVSFAKEFQGGLEQQCKDSFFVSDGAEKLNSRAARVIGDWNKKNPQRSVKVVDGFAITKDKCEYSEDGRHYPKLAFQELTTLLEGVYGAGGPSDAQFIQDMSPGVPAANCADPSLKNTVTT